MKEHGSSMEMQQDSSGSQEPSGPHSQLHRPVQVEGQGHSAEANSGDFSQPSMPMQPEISGTSHAQVHEPSRVLTPSNESQFSNSQRFSNQPVSTPEQTGTPANRGKQIPFGSLLPIIIPELDKDKSMQLQTLYGKLRRNEIAKDAFVRLMRQIVGDQMLRLAVVKMQAKVQSQSSSQQPHLRPPTGTAAQFSDPYSFGQLHQKSHNITTMTRTPASGMPPHKDSVNQMVDNNSLKSKEMEHLTDSHGVQANKISDRSAITIQGLSKQQQQHLHFPQSSYSMYGPNSYFSSSNVSTPSALAKPQSYDPQIRPGQIQQGFGSAHGDGSSQAMNVINTPKIERQNSHSEPKRLPGTMANLSTLPMQHTPVPWQVSKEQKIGTSSNLSFVKQEPAEQAFDKQLKPHISSSQGPTFSGTVIADHVESRPIPASDELLERHNPGISFPSSLRTAAGASSASVSPHTDTDFQVGSQNIPATSMSGIGSNSKVSAKKPSGGQKKPLDALASSPPLPSKKQKVVGAFSDQSIEHLNDVTAVSGVNLREEEEQLFSVPKDDGRVSEASRKAVQEEEDRLLLQKVPLQKKLAEIMTKCGLKNLSNDVERCLSLCVEERLRGLISSLIRVSKQQRVDAEKSRYNTVVTSDVREQILAINRKARDEWEKKQAEAEKLRKQNEPDSSGVVDVDKEKDEGRAKSLKMPVNKEEDDKMRTTAANVAARAAVGGDDMLSKWQLMAQARQKRDVGPETATSSQASKDGTDKQFTTSVGNSRETQGTGKGDLSTAPASGIARQGGKSQVPEQPPRAAPRISVKDVIAVLEKEPQMAKSTIIYRLYDKMHADPAADE
ncbi:Transcription initiation factor TFIID subunit 4b [Bienertia sinuspersici]